MTVLPSNPVDRPAAEVTPALQRHLDRFRLFHEQLMALYPEGSLIPRKPNRAGGWTWGYRYRDAERPLTGSSIGEDEIRLLFDLVTLGAPGSAFVIGHAFGLSTFALAVASGGTCQVFAIDSWAEGSDSKTARDLSEQLIATRPVLSRVRLTSGRSPDKTPQALAGLDGPLGILFIDGEHTNEAAAADFEGARPHLDQRTICLWHNVDQTIAAFDDSLHADEDRPWDRRYVLRSYGPLGITFSSTAHPWLDPYLASHNLIWADWQTYLPVLQRVRRAAWLLEKDSGRWARMRSGLRAFAARLARRKQ